MLLTAEFKAGFEQTAEKAHKASNWKNNFHHEDTKK